MDKVFLQILNMSITSSYVILFIILIRFLLRKAPKIYSYVLWSVAFFRLLIPISFKSILSVIPVNPQTIPIDLSTANNPVIESGINTLDGILNSSLPKTIVGESGNPIQVWVSLGITIWITGIVLLIVYSVTTTLKLNKILKPSNLLRDNIYETEGMEIPFVFGFIKPRIYIPHGLFESEKDYIIRHEETHIRRKDHIIKVLTFTIATLHWFNPLVWIAYLLMNKDMELSCDEAVVMKMGSGIKQDYSASLLRLSIGNNILGGSPLAFGGKNTKSRIKNILDYKKPKFWVSFIAVIVLIFVSVILLSNPSSNSVKIDPEDVALREVQRITSEQGYNVASTEAEDVMIGDSDVFQFIKNASIESGYSEDDFNTMSGDRKIFQYILNERSIGNEPISLDIIVDKEKAIGAYLSYFEYSPGIEPITYKNFMESNTVLPENNEPLKIVDDFIKKRANLNDKKEEIMNLLENLDDPMLQEKLNEIANDIRILLTEQEYNRLIANRYIFSENLINELYDDVQISDITYEQISVENERVSYKAIYKEIFYLDNEIKQEKDHSVKFVLDKIDGQWLISNIN